MANFKVQAFLERTRQLKEATGDFPPELKPMRFDPEAVEPSRQRSPTFSNRDVFSAAMKKATGSFQSIPERMASYQEDIQETPRLSLKEDVKVTPIKKPPTHRQGSFKRSIQSPSTPKPVRTSSRTRTSSAMSSSPKARIRSSSPGQKQPGLKLDPQRIPELERLITDLIHSRKSLEEEFKMQTLKEQQLLNILKQAGTPTKAKEQEEQQNLKEQSVLIEESYREKTQKLLMTVKEEVLVMDKKLAELLQENSILKDKVEKQKTEDRVKRGSQLLMDLQGNSRSSSRSALSSIDQRDCKIQNISDILDSLDKPNEEYNYLDLNDQHITQIFAQLEQSPSPEGYKDLCKLLAKKTIMEKQHRLKTEEQGTQMLDQEDKMIAKLVVDM